MLAALGVALQTTALVFPGLATYHFQWKKGDVPVAGYGYLCFFIGTVSLTIGIMLCGHIIESTTDETNYELSEDSKNEGYRFLCLQKALTLGDQEFPSCAIFLGGDSGVLRTSRRGFQRRSSTWSRATLWVFVTLSGYIVQFVGLRALHWSATIVQLGVTIIMTCIRALARMSLASDPETSTLSLTGHEIAWLTSLVKFEGEKVSAQKGVCHHQQPFEYFNKGRADIASHSNDVDFDKGQLFWEIISDHSEESGAVVDWLNDATPSTSSDTHMGDRTGFVSSKLLQRIRGPLKSSFNFHPERPDEPETSENENLVQTHMRIATGIRAPNLMTEDNNAERASAALFGVINDIMSSSTENGSRGISDFDWSPEALEAWEKASELCWEFNVREGRVSEYNNKERTQSRFKISLRPNRKRQRRFGAQSWGLDQSARVQLEAAISLSLYTDAARQMYAAGEAKTGIKVTPGRTDRRFRRIVGHAERGDASRLRVHLQMFIPSHVQSSTMSSMRNEEVNMQMKELVKAVCPSWGLPAVQKNRLPATTQEPRETTATHGQLRELELAQMGGEMRPLTQMIRQGVSKSYFGMFLSSSA
ncbi:ankyrin repeat protein [Colletotrichum kahawae]|uniref:Ankyrin repeat protein n=1 Tax=Colletotrichum kahawae TaxID=34407 RepID=A0AAD9YMR7_COLKA|nr:ankyrin repeat protein [Colletotrichum kahawae]